jgi:hypothetical protein
MELDRPFEKDWDDLNAYVENVFFTNVNKVVNGAAYDLADDIERKLTKQLDTFFSNLSDMVGRWKNAAPKWVQDINGPWTDYSDDYADFKQVRERGARDYFVLREMAPVARSRTRLARRLRRERFTRGKKKGKLRGPSLKQELKTLGNPSAYWGRVVVTIESMTNTDTGRRRYNKGTQRRGKRPGGQILSPAADYLTLHIEWLPSLEGLDVLDRGVTEEPREGMLGLPGEIAVKLETIQWRKDGKQAYRPLLGPYMLWYQDTTVRQTIQKITAQHGAQL